MTIVSPAETPCNISILDSDFEGFDKSIGLMNFHIKINAINGVLKRSPNIPFVDINLKDLNIKNFVVATSYRQRIELAK